MFAAPPRRAAYASNTFNDAAQSISYAVMMPTTNKNQQPTRSEAETNQNANMASNLTAKPNGEVPAFFSTGLAPSIGREPVALQAPAPQAIAQQQLLQQAPTLLEPVQQAPPQQTVTQQQPVLQSTTAVNQQDIFDASPSRDEELQEDVSRAPFSDEIELQQSESVEDLLSSRPQSPEEDSSSNLIESSQSKRREPAISKSSKSRKQSDHKRNSKKKHRREKKSKTTAKPKATSWSSRTKKIVFTIVAALTTMLAVFVLLALINPTFVQKQLPAHLDHGSVLAALDMRKAATLAVVAGVLTASAPLIWKHCAPHAASFLPIKF